MVEPAADCQKCPNRFGMCAEFTALNRPDNPYNREWCHWGAESIKKEKEEKSPEHQKQMRKYCAGCNHTLNCPVGMLQFKTCTQKGSNLISMKGKHIPTWAEEQEAIQKMGESKEEN